MSSASLTDPTIRSYGANTEQFAAEAIRNARAHAMSVTRHYRSEMADARKYATHCNPVRAAAAVQTGVRAITQTGPWALETWKRYREIRAAWRAVLEENAGRDLAAARVEAGLAETIPAPECAECAEEKAGEFCSGKCERAAEKTEQEREQASLYPTRAAYRNGVPQ